MPRTSYELPHCHPRQSRFPRNTPTKRKRLEQFKTSNRTCLRIFTAQEPIPTTTTVANRSAGPTPARPRTGLDKSDNQNQEKCISDTRRPISLQLALVGCEGTMPEKRPDAPTRRVSLIERWPCELEACRNHGQMCYWTVSDEVANHLPITSIVMQIWLTAISRGECTPDVPPHAIVEQWAAQNMRSLQRREERKEVRRVQRAERLSQKLSTRKTSTRKATSRRSSISALSLG
jgi:hypothetical protein